MKSPAKSKKQIRIAELSMEDGSTVTDMTEMANVFNEYFINTVSNLRATTDETQIGTSKLENFVSSAFDNYITHFDIPVMTHEETLKMIETLRHGKPTGPDDISVKVRKLAAPALCHPLTKFLTSPYKTVTSLGNGKLHVLLPCTEMVFVTIKTITDKYLYCIYYRSC